MLIHTLITKNSIYEKNPAFTILLLFFTEKELLLKQFLKNSSLNESIETPVNLLDS